MLIEDKIFNKIDFISKPLPKGEYEYCKFINCDFSQTNFFEIKFLECNFNACNLSLIKLGQTVFRDIRFCNCKMLGLNFEHCSEFGFTVNFEDCILNHTSFFKRCLKNIGFKNCKLIETDFTDADLTGAVFEHCDLKDAKFKNTILEKSDFSSAYNFSINPEINKIKKAIFSMGGLPGLLGKYEIEIKA